MKDKYFLDLLTLETEMIFREYTDSTKNTYKRYVKDFLEYTEKETLEINKDDIERYLDTCLETDSKNTVLIKLNALEFFFNEILGLDVTEKVKKYEREFKVKELIKTEQIDILTVSVETKEKLLYKIAVETGMKISKIKNLIIDDLKKDKEEWKLAGYVIPITLARDLTEFAEQNDIENYLFYSKNGEQLHETTIRNWLRISTKQYLGKEYTFSDLRHRKALEMWKVGKKDEAVKYLQVKNRYTVIQYYKRIGYELEI